MIPFIVLTTTFLLCLGAGAAGWHLFHDWHTALIGGLVMMFLTTASAHWGRMRPDLVRMVPPSMGRSEQMVTLTGILEITGAIGLAFPSTRRFAALCLVVLLLAMLPANVYTAKAKLLLGGKPATPLYWRLPLQALFAACLIAAAF